MNDFTMNLQMKQYTQRVVPLSTNSKAFVPQPSRVGAFGRPEGKRQRLRVSDSRHVIRGSLRDRLATFDPRLFRGYETPYCLKHVREPFREPFQ